MHCFFIGLSIFTCQVAFNTAKVIPVCPEGGGDKYAGCGYWKRLGYCLEKNGYRDQMEKNCPATCNFCKDLAQPTPPPKVQAVQVNIRECLKAHNEKRAIHGARPLKWDTSLANDAQQWALHLAKTDTFVHAPFSGSGENISWQEKNQTCPEAVEKWYAEESNYPFSNPPHSVLDYSGENAIGHFTQIVWKSTSRVGVGIATIVQGNTVIKTYIVSRYTPPGNYDGQLGNEVGEPISVSIKT